VSHASKNPPNSIQISNRKEGVVARDLAMTDPSLNASYACVHCGSSAQGRNLVVCIDGTSNNFSVKVG